MRQGIRSSGDGMAEFSTPIRGWMFPEKTDLFDPETRESTRRSGAATEVNRENCSLHVLYDHLQNSTQVARILRGGQYPVYPVHPCFPFLNSQQQEDINMDRPDEQDAILRVPASLRDSFRTTLCVWVAALRCARKKTSSRDRQSPDWRGCGFGRLCRIPGIARFRPLGFTSPGAGFQPLKGKGGHVTQGVASLCLGLTGPPCQGWGVFSLMGASQSFTFRSPLRGLNLFCAFFRGFPSVPPGWLTSLRSTSPSPPPGAKNLKKFDFLESFG